MTDQHTYRIEFGPAWPVPPITVDFTDRGAAINAVTEHAIPHLKTILAAKGRPELADCFFRTDPGLTEGSFMWVNLAEGMSALFCPARLTPAEDTEETHVVADDSDDPEHVDDCPGCEAVSGAADSRPA